MLNIANVTEKANTTVLTIVCPFCGEQTIVEVPNDGIEKRRNGALMQDAFPNLSTEKRETLISGLCLKCQEKSFDK